MHALVQHSVQTVPGMFGCFAFLVGEGVRAKGLPWQTHARLACDSGDVFQKLLLQVNLDEQQ